MEKPRQQPDQERIKRMIAAGEEVERRARAKRTPEDAARLIREVSRQIDEISMNDEEAWLREDESGKLTSSYRYKQYWEALKLLKKARLVLGEEE